MWTEQERAYVQGARVGRLATADAGGRPHVVPICVALVAGDLVTPIDEKPKQVSPEALRRSRDVAENPHVAVVFDHYSEDWSRLGWVQVRGTATFVEPRDQGETRGLEEQGEEGEPRETRDLEEQGEPDEDRHGTGFGALRRKYDQYADHDLEGRPLIWIEAESVRSWGALE